MVHVVNLTDGLTLRVSKNPRITPGAYQRPTQLSAATNVITIDGYAASPYDTRLHVVKSH